MISNYKHPDSKASKLASRKGIILTAFILAAITGASFIFWMLPQETPSTFVVTDYENYLDGAKKIHEVLDESINIEFQNMLDGTITPEEYVEITQITSSQVTAQITEFVKSKPPDPWQESYIAYMDALRTFNSYIVETRVAANMVGDEAALMQSLQKTEELKEEYRQLIRYSDSSRP